MAKDFRENRRGCFIVGAILLLVLAAFAWGMIDTGKDARSNPNADVKGASIPAPPAQAGSAPPPRVDPKG
jgi:hypothetical protein